MSSPATELPSSIIDNGPMRLWQWVAVAVTVGLVAPLLLFVAGLVSLPSCATAMYMMLPVGRPALTISPELPPFITSA